MQASQVSCVNVHVCLYVTYNTPISQCTTQLSLKQTPLRVFTFTPTQIKQGDPDLIPFARVRAIARASPQEASGAQQHAKGMQRRLVKIEIISDTI